jgi:filamentous hemagglutinin
MAQVIEVGAAIDAAIIVAPLALGEVGGASLGLESTAVQVRGVQVTEAGLDLISEHLATNVEGATAENAAMMGRLQTAMANGLRSFGADANFYMHEAYEATMMNRGTEYAVAHAAALARYGVSQYALYHPQVIATLHEAEGIFSEGYLKYWGIP